MIIVSPCHTDDWFLISSTKIRVRPIYLTRTSTSSGNDTRQIIHYFDFFANTERATQYLPRQCQHQQAQKRFILFPIKFSYFSSFLVLFFSHYPGRARLSIRILYPAHRPENCTDTRSIYLRSQLWATHCFRQSMRIVPPTFLHSRRNL